MQNLEIPATTRTPSVAFDFGKHHLKLSGESYPEDVTEFYNPVFSALDTYLGTLGSNNCRFDFELIYLNSSSAKAVMMLMDKLDRAAAKGATVHVYWFYDEEDDTMQELGEEFGRGPGERQVPPREDAGLMSRDGLFAGEEQVIATGEQLVADGGFSSPQDKQHYEQLLKSYQKLFRVTRRLMRLSDNNERQLNAAADVIAQKNNELEALSTKLSKYLSPQIYNSIFTGAQAVEIASSRKKLTIFFSDVVKFHRDHGQARIRGAYQSAE